ncbi:MAG: hypothetical protein QM677_04950 [Microbacterium sp.]
MNTPEMIYELADGEVLVFGSNAAGLHYGGAARMAHERFGAEWGVGEGLTGRSYALPTMEGLDALRAAVGRFLVFAAEHPELRFLVTPVGCGIAGHVPAEVGPAFGGHRDNVIIPASFQAAIEKRQS